MKASPFSDLMIQIQALRRRIDDANRDMVCGSAACLSRLPDDVARLCELAKTLPTDKQQQAIFALSALDADISAYSRILHLRHNHMPKRGELAS